MKVIHPTSYEELLSNGRTVPKSKTYYYFERGFKVGGESHVTNGQKNCPPIKVRCTQNNPFHLIVIKP